MDSALFLSPLLLLLCACRLKDLYTTEALPLDTFQSVDELSVEAILSAYTSRNLTTRLANVAPVWKADTASSFQLPFATRSFSASLHVRVEEVQLRCARPCLARVLRP